MMIVFLFCLCFFLFSTYFYWNVNFKNFHYTRVPILGYHNISNLFNISATRVKVEAFRGHLKYLSDEGYHCLSLAEALPYLGKCSDPPQKSFVVIFDDGFQDLLVDAIPLLKSFRFTASIFLVTGYLGQESRWDVLLRTHRQHHLSSSEIRTLLGDGFTIGSHTVNHPDLTLLPDNLILKELIESKEFLEKTFNIPIHFLSYPFGRTEERVKSLVRQAGYRAALSQGQCQRQGSPDLMEICTLPINVFDGNFNLENKLTRNQFFWLEQIKIICLNQFSRGTPLIKPMKRV